MSNPLHCYNSGLACEHSSVVVLEVVGSDGDGQRPHLQPPHMKDVTLYQEVVTLARWLITASWSLGGRFSYPVMAATGARLDRSYSQLPVSVVEPGHSDIAVQCSQERQVVCTSGKYLECITRGVGIVRLGDLSEQLHVVVA